MRAAQYAMTGLGLFSKDMMGTGVQIFEAACTPSTGLSVSIAAGRIYSMQPLEATQWSSLPADTVDQILKQGSNLAATNLACPAPTTAGQSIAYLIEGQYQDLDGNDQALSYWNSTNPNQPFSGAGGNLAAQPTTRAGIFALQTVAGTSAATGSQTTPATTSGWTAMYVVTVAYGATSIVTGNIVEVGGAPINGAGLTTNYATQAQLAAAVAAGLSTAETFATAAAAAATTAAESAAEAAAATSAAAAIAANGPKFRIGTFSCTNGTVTVNFSPPFPNACTEVVVMTNFASPDVGTLTGTPTATSFEYTNGNAGNCMYIAAGN